MRPSPVIPNKAGMTVFAEKKTEPRSSRMGGIQNDFAGIKKSRNFCSGICGDDRTRTDHPLIANQMLYQMSYAPISD